VFEPDELRCVEVSMDRRTSLRSWRARDARFFERVAAIFPNHHRSRQAISVRRMLVWSPTWSFKRLGHPDAIAAAVAFVASDDARWITGRNIRVDGGTVS
jgi:NAD(P)-dependent dehydrogenase (short-subunit alcohol dehydrogenase family)